MKFYCLNIFYVSLNKKVSDWKNKSKKNPVLKVVIWSSTFCAIFRGDSENGERKQSFSLVVGGKM